MSREGAPTIENQEKPKAISLERINASSVSIEVGGGTHDDFFGIFHIIQSIVEDKGLFEAIPNEKTSTIEVRSFNPDGKVPEEVVDEIQVQIDKINPIF